MNLGQLSILVAFLSGFGASILYFFNGRRAAQKGAVLKPSQERSPWRLYLVMVGASLVAGVTLLTLILTPQFQYAYVANYSSLDLPTLYLVSAFWSGQEGTFLLWAILAGIMGLIFIRFSKTRDDLAAGVFTAFLAFLYLLLLRKSPFEELPMAPPDGRGLNPLLQSYWMAIHPPILFSGYAATVFPFALVLSGLLRKNFDRWNTSGFTWSMFATLALGTGIMLGGFWAYEVLGWGGYWGWDPVENSSLVPWLLLLALVHGLLIHKAKGSLLRTTLFLGIAPFLLVLYATFLTRSGVLADFSVHSFVDLGINSYLIAVMLIAAAAALGLFFFRFSSLKSPRVELAGVQRESVMLLSLYVLLAAAVFTLVGMSSPLLTGLVGKASQVDTPFYNRVNLPVAIAAALLLGVTPFLGWAREGIAALMKKLSLPLAATALGAVIGYVSGVTTFSLLLFVALSAFALTSNLIVAFRQYRMGWKHLGAPLAHIGTALLFIGIVGSGKFDDTTQLALQPGVPQSAYGYQFTFKGISETPDRKQAVDIEVSDGRSSFMTAPKLYFSEYNQAMLREPAIKILPLKDIYISPLELRPVSGGAGGGTENPSFELTKGETKDVGGYQVNFVGFDMTQHEQEQAMAVGAVLKITSAGKEYEVVPRLLINDKGDRSIAPADLPPLPSGGASLEKPRIALTAISVEEKKILLELMGFGGHAHGTGAESHELIVSVSTKPLMMVVWTGVVLIILGVAFAWRKRSTT